MSPYFIFIISCVLVVGVYIHQIIEFIFYELNEPDLGIRITRPSQPKVQINIKLRFKLIFGGLLLVVCFKIYSFTLQIVMWCDRLIDESLWIVVHLQFVGCFLNSRLRHKLLFILNPPTVQKQKTCRSNIISYSINYWVMRFYAYLNKKLYL